MIRLVTYPTKLTISMLRIFIIMAVGGQELVHKCGTSSPTLRN